ncbi:MAG: hypothetical protein ACOYYU_09495 [Chloroflexota bacterium]
MTPKEHQLFTNAWRNTIGYINSSNPIRTGSVNAQQVWEAAQRIYVDYPALLDAAKTTIFGQ